MTLANLSEDMTREGIHQDADERSWEASRLEVCRGLSKAIGEEIKKTEETAIEAGYARRWNKTSESPVTMISKMPSLSDAVKAGVFFKCIQAVVQTLRLSQFAVGANGDVAVLQF